MVAPDVGFEQARDNHVAHFRVSGIALAANGRDSYGRGAKHSCKRHRSVSLVE
jgi:hypothetical protein